MANIWTELKRRNVVRVGIAYGLVCWMLLQIADFALEVIDAPGWILQVLVLLAAIGLPAVLVFAWVYEMTPEGIKRETEVDRSQSVTAHTGRRLNAVIVVVLVLAVGFLGVSRFLAPPNGDAGRGAAAGDEVSRSIAVLPFDDFSEAGDQDYFSKGIAEEILNLLAKNGALRVAARTSSFAFADTTEDIRDIGRKLDVGTVLEGSIRKSGDTVRVTAQLINVEDGYHLWSETYDREYEDIFRIQDEIASNIMDALRVHLLGEEKRVPDAERTVDLDAYSAFLIGRERMELRKPEDVAAAREQFEKAIALDPDYAPAHAALAHSWLVSEELGALGDDFGRDEIDATVEPLLERALELAPNLPEAIAIQGFHDLRRKRYEDAEQAFDRALELNPNYALAYTWRASIAHHEERYLDMLADREKAYALDPMSLEIAADLAAAYRNFWRPKDAERVIERMFELHPDHPQAYRAAIINLSFHGRYGEATLLTERAMETNSGDEWFSRAQEAGFIRLGLYREATASDDPHTPFSAALHQEDFERAEAIVAEQLKGDDPNEHWVEHGRQLYAVHPGEDSEAKLRDFVAREVEYLDSRDIPWREQCKPFLIDSLRRVGRDEPVESMMEKCRSRLEELIKASYLCPCSWYNVVLVTIVDGRLDEAVERADFWLSNGDSNSGLHVDAVFRRLSERPEYNELLARNAQQVERQREIYLNGGGWGALKKPDEVVLER
ncbi:MAG: hypothetical protein R3200_08150 [Xanthomonadales bacterium]|nr:hypothetical protein [Xanthomonadales bacterium]